MSESGAPTIIPRSLCSRAGFRFEIRPYELGVEAEVYAAAVASREAIAPWMGWMHPEYCENDNREWIAGAIESWNAGTSYEFFIVDRDDGSIVGSCGLNVLNRLDLVCNLGYWVSTAKTGFGAATQAAKLLCEFGFEAVGLNRLEIVVADGNVGSRRVAEKVGAVYEGIQRCRLRVGERVHDAHMYACLRDGAATPLPA